MKTRLVAVGVGVMLTGSGLAQTSELYLVDGKSRIVSVVQNGAVVRTWPLRYNNMPITVYYGRVQTWEQYQAMGSEYDLYGNWTGTDYPSSPNPSGQKDDAATDGTNYNWIAAWGDYAVWQTDRAWNNPVRLFPAKGPTGITYDRNTGHLWVIEWGIRSVVEYDLAGNVISRFDYKTPSGWLGCLAWEPATDTLWAMEFSSGDLFQFDKKGKKLQTINVPGVAGYAWGGEFDVSGSNAHWSNYDAGFPGTNGIPGFVASNPPVLGGPISLTADNSEGQNRIGGFLVSGLAPLSIQGNWGGKLLVNPLYFQSVPIPVSGLVISTTLPNDPTLDNVSVYLQVLEFDPGAAKGISNTPGLMLTFGL